MSDYRCGLPAAFTAAAAALLAAITVTAAILFGAAHG